MENERSKLWWAYASLAGGVLALTLSPLFFRWSEAPGLVISFYRMVVAAACLTPFAIAALRKQSWPPRAYFLFPVLGGIFSSLDHGLWGTSISRTTVANATLLNNLSPLWVALFAIVVWKERLLPRFWAGLVATLAGASLVLGSTILIRPDFAVGDYLAALSSVFYAGFFLATQKGRRLLDTVLYLWVMSASAGIALLAYTQLFKMPLGGYTPADYGVFLSAGLISQLGAYFFIAYSLGRLPASIVTPTMVAQPVLTALLAIPLMGEALLLPQVAGGLITLGGIYLLNTAKPAEEDQSSDNPSLNQS